MKENPLQYRVRGTPVPTTQTRGTNYPKSTTCELTELVNKSLFAQVVEISVPILKNIS